MNDQSSRASSPLRPGSRSLRISVLFDAGGWLEEHLQAFAALHDLDGHQVSFANELHAVGPTDLLVLFGYSRVLNHGELARATSTLVVHASDLPRGRGWSPYVWDIVEGAATLTVSLIDAASPVDSGDIIHQASIALRGSELLPEIRAMVVACAVDLVRQAATQICDGVLSRQPQRGDPTYRRRRTRADAELDPERTIASQMDLLRAVDNVRFPAWFRFRDRVFRVLILPEEDIQ